MAGGSRVNLRLPPRVIEAARAAQYANREGLAARELDQEIRRKVQQQTTAAKRAAGLDREGGQLEFSRREQQRIWTRRRVLAEPFALIRFDWLFRGYASIESSAGVSLSFGLSADSLTPVSESLSYADQGYSVLQFTNGDKAVQGSPYFAILPSGFNSVSSFLERSTAGKYIGETLTGLPAGSDFVDDAAAIAAARVIPASVLESVAQEYPSIMFGDIDDPSAATLYVNPTGGQGVFAYGYLSVHILVGTADAAAFNDFYGFIDPYAFFNMGNPFRAAGPFDCAWPYFLSSSVCKFYFGSNELPSAATL